MILGLDRGTNAWTFLFWCYLIGQHTIESLRTDLEHWLNTNQLPFSTQSRFAVQLFPSIPGYIVINYLAAGLCIAIGIKLSIAYIVIFPLAIISITLANAIAILRQCHCTELMAGIVPEPGAAGFLMGVIGAGISVILIPWIANHYFPANLNWLFILFNIAISLGVIYLFDQLAIKVYQRIK